MLVRLHSMTLDTDTGLLAVDGPAGVRVLDLAALVRHEAVEVNAAIGQPEERGLEAGAGGGERTVLSDGVPLPGRLHPPDMV